jgi:beta-glucosidase
MSRKPIFAGACLMLGMLSAWPAIGRAEAAFSPQVKELLSQLSLEEKLSLTQGTHDPAYLGQAGYVAGVPRLKIPALRMADGPSGILNRYDTTALPQAIALAATFDPILSREYGAVLGAEARATGMDVVLGPMVNIARVPNWGRNITSFGEDPLLTSRLVSTEIEGIQAQGAMATTKHFVANNQSEHQGGGLNNDPGYDFKVDARTLHELYLPAFEAAVRAGTASIMAAYNHINGAWNAENKDTLTGILRDEMSWQGFVMSDWHANHSSAAMAAGLDMEMPGLGPVQPVGAELPYFGEPLKALIASGQLPLASLNQAVGRVLTQMEKLGMLNERRVAAPAAIDVEAHAASARKIATLGAVLLKNDGILPLKPAILRGTIALIGPTARQVAVGPGGGRSEGFPQRLIAPADAFKAGGASQLSFAVGDDLEGVAIPAAAFHTDGGHEGLLRSTSDGVAAITEPNIDHVAHALPAGRRYVWRGQLRVPESGLYLISSQSWGGSTELSIDGAVKATSARLAFGNGVPHRLSSLLPTTDGLDNGQSFLRLDKDRDYAVVLTAQAESSSTMQVRLSWVTPDMQRRHHQAAVEAARLAETAIVFAWARGGEGFDASQSLSLPYDQDQLIADIAAANPNTIVVLNTGNPISMPWLPTVRAVLEMWFPGQEGSWATVDLLTGRANPAGRLPISFPQRASDTPALAADFPERAGAGPEKSVVYSEGIFVGYRYYAEMRRAPAFVFGYGLSYSKFEYSALKLTPNRRGARVAFEVRNAGTVSGIDTPQVYVTRPDSAPVPMAPRTLAGFTRVELKPGEHRTVSLDIDDRQMAYWSAETHGWKVPPGRRRVIVAADAGAEGISQSLNVAGKSF